MGALRAADCWPAGMRGLGTIYRLFRRGSLRSDDEVAVSFLATPPYRAVTIPLVNVRYAIRRAVRERLLTVAEADRIVRAAAEQFFADRHWAAILDAAGVQVADERVLTFLRAHDLKRLDAFRALRTVRAWTETPDARRRTRLGRPRLPAVDVREASGYRLGPHRRVESHRLWRWLIATGGYRRYPAALAGVQDVTARTTRRRRHDDHDDVHIEAAACVDANSEWSTALAITRRGVATALTHGRSSCRLLDRLQARERKLASRVWAEMAALGDVEAFVVRFLAIERAAAWARRHHLTPSAGQWHIAREELAANHGFRAWTDLRNALADGVRAWTAIKQVCEDLALAKRVRHELFTTLNGSEGPPTPADPSQAGSHEDE